MKLFLNVMLYQKTSRHLRMISSEKGNIFNSLRCCSQGHIGARDIIRLADLHTSFKLTKAEEPPFFFSQYSFAGERGRKLPQSKRALENQSGSNCLWQVFMPWAGEEQLGMHTCAYTHTHRQGKRKDRKNILFNPMKSYSILERIAPCGGKQQLHLIYTTEAETHTNPGDTHLTHFRLMLIHKHTINTGYALLQTVDLYEMQVKHSPPCLSLSVIWCWADHYFYPC